MMTTERPKSSTRAIKNAAQLERQFPRPAGLAPYATVIPTDILASAHRAVGDLSALETDAAHALRSAKFAMPQNFAKHPLFSGVIHFVRLQFRVKATGQLISVSEADMQVARDYAALAVVPISQYATQYGPNSLQVSSNFIETTVDIPDTTYDDNYVHNWVKVIAQQNSLASSDAVVILNPPALVNKSQALSDGTGGYHYKAQIAYAFVNLRGSGLAISDAGWLFAGPLSHELAEMTVDPDGNDDNPEVCDACGPNYASTWLAYFDDTRTYIATSQAFPPPFPYHFFLNGICRPDFVTRVPPALSLADQALACNYPPVVDTFAFTAASAPASAGRANNLFVVATDSSGQIWYDQAAPGAAFVGWQEVPGELVAVGAPGAGMRGTTLFVLGRTADGQIHFNDADAGQGFIGWQPLPGGVSTSAAPTCAGSKSDVFVVATDENRSVQLTHAPPGNAFSAWQAVSGVSAVDAPAAAVRGTTLFIFVRTSDGAIHFNQGGPGNFLGWQSLPAPFVAAHAPAAAARAGNVFVFVVDQAGRVWFNQAAPGGPFVGWQVIPGGLIAGDAPGAGMQGDKLFVFARRADGRLFYNQADPGGAFVGWQDSSLVF